MNKHTKGRNRMKHIRIPIPTYRWLTISWGTADTQKQTAEPTAQPTTAEPTAPAPRRYNSRGRYSPWLKETGRTRKSWERYYQLDRIRMELMVMRCGHKAPFTQEEIVAQGDLFKRYLAQRTDPDTQGRGRPRLRSI
jgi:hypothetical protein